MLPLQITLFALAGMLTGLHAGIRYNGAMLRVLEVLVVNFFIIRLLIAFGARLNPEGDVIANPGLSAIAYLVTFALARVIVRRLVRRTDEAPVETESYWEKR